MTDNTRPDYGYLGIRNIDDLTLIDPDYGDSAPAEANDDEQEGTMRPAAPTEPPALHANDYRQDSIVALTQ